MIKSITIFGGSGFLGSHIVRELAKTHAAIQIVSRNRFEGEALKPCGDVGQITALEGDITDVRQVAYMINGADVVINLVGILYEKGKQTFDRVHRQGAETIARVAAEKGCKHLIHISALGSDPESPSKYARSKAAGEEAVRTHFPEAVIFRPSIVFGPEDSFFNKFAAMTMISPFLPVIGDGQTKFQPVYAGDIADAVHAALKTASARGKTFELGGPEIYTFEDLLQLTLHEVQRDKKLLRIPVGMARLQARFWELMPKPPITRDQIKLLERDNVVSKKAKTLADLGVESTALEAILPSYLYRFRPGGQWADKRADNKVVKKRNQSVQNPPKAPKSRASKKKRAA